VTDFFTGFTAQRYRDSSFITQQKARTLFIFNMVTLALLLIFMISLNATSKRDTFSLINVVFLFIMVIVTTGIILIRAGNYRSAANLTVTGAVVALGVLVNFGQMKFNIGIITSNYISIIFIVFTALFCTRRMTVFITFLVLLFSGLSFMRTDLLSRSESITVFINFTFQAGLIAALCFFLMKIIDMAIARLEKELKNEEQLISIKNILQSVRDVSLELNNSSEQMESVSKEFSESSQDQAAHVEEITATIEEISAGAESVAQISLNQHESIQSLLGQMEELSGMINQIKNEISEGERLSDDISGYARNGEKRVGEMSSSMEKISRSSGEANRIIQIIKDISDRINLLSLNASIEAARAGESGRGFAVVAEEISKLGDSTTSSVKEIEDLIIANVTETRRGMDNVVSAVEAIDLIIKGIEGISSMVAVIGDNISQQAEVNSAVNRAAGDVMMRSEEIKNSSDEQKNASLEIVKAVSNINELTQANASGAELVSRSSKDIAEYAGILLEKVEAFNY